MAQVLRAHFWVHLTVRRMVLGIATYDQRGVGNSPFQENIFWKCVASSIDDSLISDEK